MLLINHIKWDIYHHDIMQSQITYGGDSLQMWQ